MKNILITFAMILGVTAMTGAIYVGNGVPNPFVEQVISIYYTVVSNDLYSICIGPMTDKYATVSTTIDRWRVETKKKLNMSEETKTIKE